MLVSNVYSIYAQQFLFFIAYMRIYFWYLWYACASILQIKKNFFACHMIRVQTPRVQIEIANLKLVKISINNFF